MIARVGPREAVRVEAPLRKMILALPDMLAQIGQWSRELPVPPALRRVHTLALACREPGGFSSRKGPRVVWLP
ncbi:MAG: hypothetical protein IPI26_08195 [Elusimicrobia bacterium]|nr:hypothetical protein [Elusimicrobiota bacterium]